MGPSTDAAASSYSSEGSEPPELYASITVDTTLPGVQELRMLLRAVVHYNSVCSLVTWTALEVLGTSEEAGTALFDLWFQNHAVRCQHGRVTQSIGARDLSILMRCTPVLAHVL